MVNRDINGDLMVINPLVMVINPENQQFLMETSLPTPWLPGSMLIYQRVISYWCVLRREFLGMIHWLTINNHPSNPQQPIHSLRLAPVSYWFHVIVIISIWLSEWSINWQIPSTNMDIDIYNIILYIYTYTHTPFESLTNHRIYSFWRPSHSRVFWCDLGMWFFSTSGSSGLCFSRYI